jgi:hypothetical protein
MKTRFNNWKRWSLVPFLCILLALAGGCGGTASRERGEKQDAQELQRIEASAENPASGEFDDLQETDADEGGDSYDPESDYGGEETESRDSGSGEIEENGVYTTMEDVALYLHTYGKLPLNFMTKKEARALGWSGGSLEDYAPGMCIGGDYFGNYEGTLPDGKYHECDINTLGAKRRGAERLIYSDDGRIYYTDDHYETFTLLYRSSE